MTLRTLMSAAALLVFASGAASAQDGNVKHPEFKEQLPPGQIASKITNAGNVGIVVLISYDGSIQSFATDGGTLTYEHGELPDGNLGSGTIQIEVDRNSPGCIWCTHGGQRIKICD